MEYDRDYQVFQRIQSLDSMQKHVKFSETFVIFNYHREYHHEHKV